MNENNDELNLSGEFDELDNKIILNDEDGNEIEFEFLDVVEVDGNEYVVLLPVDEAEKGDLEAQQWLYHNGELLAKDSLAAIKHLKMSKNVVIGFRGGFASNVHYVQEGVMDTLIKKGINPTIVKGDKDPIYGAYYMAKRKGLIWLQ